MQDLHSASPHLLESGLWLVPCQRLSSTSQCIPLCVPSDLSVCLHSRLPWVSYEDEVLKAIVQAEGPNDWIRIAEILKGKVHTGHVSKQCRARYFDLLSSVPCVWSSGEDLFILKKYHEIGHNWREISKHLYERSESQVKCRFKALLETGGTGFQGGEQLISDLIEFKEKEVASTFDRKYIEQNCTESPSCRFQETWLG